VRLAAPRLAPLSATTVGFALGAAPVVERALALPGAGRVLADAAASGDVPVVAALAALAAATVAATAALAHGLARRADPRLAEDEAVAR
jgi:peptide/nickel transport system permease protein